MGDWDVSEPFDNDHNVANAIIRYNQNIFKMLNGWFPVKTLSYHSISQDFKLQGVGKIAPPIVSFDVFMLFFYLFPGWYVSSDFLLAIAWDWTVTVP